MSIIIGIICLSASLYYGITAARQKDRLGGIMRMVSSILFYLAAGIWLFLR